MKRLLQQIAQINEQHAKNPFCKNSLESFLAEQLNLEHRRSVFTSTTHTFRVSLVRGSTKGFPNVVLGLSTLLKIDDMPFVVIIVRKNRLDYLLCNSSLLKKISHSSQKLSLDNIKGSFLGNDIKTVFRGIDNKPENFSKLFKIHQAISQDDNTKRLVEATQAIIGTGKRFIPTEIESGKIFNAPQRYQTFTESSLFHAVEKKILDHVMSVSQYILAAAKDSNINTRGNSIEQIITGQGNKHGLADGQTKLSDGTTLLFDVKTKLFDLKSQPKAFNIDKTLKILAKETYFFCFLLVIINKKTQQINTRLIPILAQELLSCLRRQHHWAGRNSRGATQFTGDLYQLSDSRRPLSINQEFALSHIQEWINIDTSTG
jgi:hypothetical protein